MLRHGPGQVGSFPRGERLRGARLGERVGAVPDKAVVREHTLLVGGALWALDGTGSMSAGVVDHDVAFLVFGTRL